ncbi:MAG: hypothetical protein QXW35_03815 [Candidatus Aenigmatarchaeota archaeon]
MANIEIPNPKEQKKEKQVRLMAYVYLKRLKNQYRKEQEKLKIEESEICKNIKESIKTEVIKTITDIMDKVVEDAKMQKIRFFGLKYVKLIKPVPTSLIEEEGLYFNIASKKDGLENEIRFMKFPNGDYVFVFDNDNILKSESIIKRIRFDGLNFNLKKIFKEIVKKYYPKLKHIALMNAIKEYNQKYNKNISIKDIELDKKDLIMIIKPFRARIGSKYRSTWEWWKEIGFYFLFKDLYFE